MINKVNYIYNFTCVRKKLPKKMNNQFYQKFKFL